eukprot:GDKI01029173.1.p1 GENE.GDKI01029173.1~~GDKI01029173.1.p1  ORF type:complete len:439 (-),score=71.31 GDKI01029173.1:232-1548(-)
MKVNRYLIAPCLFGLIHPIAHVYAQSTSDSGCPCSSVCGLNTAGKNVCTVAAADCKAPCVCQTGVAGTQFDTCTPTGGGDAQNTTPSTTKKLYNNLEYVGCYKDEKSTPDLSYKAGLFSDKPMYNCNQKCASEGYTHFGIQFFTECYCGNSYGSYGLSSDAANCQVCSDQTQARCCITGYNAVYKVGEYKQNDCDVTNCQQCEIGTAQSCDICMGGCVFKSVQSVIGMTKQCTKADDTCCFTGQKGSVCGETYTDVYKQKTDTFATVNVPHGCVLQVTTVQSTEKQRYDGGDAQKLPDSVTDFTCDCNGTTGLSGAAIGGIIGGVVGFLILVGLLVFGCLWWKKKQSGEARTHNDPGGVLPHTQMVPQNMVEDHQHLQVNYNNAHTPMNPTPFPPTQPHHTQTGDKVNTEGMVETTIRVTHPANKPLQLVVGNPMYPD